MQVKRIFRRLRKASRLFLLALAALLLGATIFLLLNAPFVIQLRIMHYWHWRAGGEVERRAVSLGTNQNACTVFRLDGSLPVAAVTECDEHVRNHCWREGTRVKLGLRGEQVTWVLAVD